MKYDCAKTCPSWKPPNERFARRGGALLRPPPSLPLRGKVAPQGRMRGNLADNALYRTIFLSPPACREGSCSARPQAFPCGGKVAPQGRMRGNLADNAFYRAIFPPPARL